MQGWERNPMPAALVQRVTSATTNPESSAESVVSRPSACVPQALAFPRQIAMGMRDLGAGSGLRIQAASNAPSNVPVR